MRAMHRLLAVALLLTAVARPCPAEEPADATPLSIAEGIRARQARMTEYRLSVEVRHTRTPFGLERQRAGLQAAHRGNGSRRSRPLPSPPRAEVVSRLEFLESPPRRAFIATFTDGPVLPEERYDGTTLRTYRTDGGPFNQYTFHRQPSPPTSRLVGPGRLDEVFGRPLTELLTDPGCAASVRGTRLVDGERLADVELRVPAAPVPGAPYQRADLTVNVTRQHWPVFVRTEAFTEPGAPPFQIDERKAEGWIGSHGVVYPRHLEQRTWAHSLPPDSSVGASDPAPQLVSTIEFAVRSFDARPNFAPADFALAVPAGEVYFDVNERAHFEIDDGGRAVPYVPRLRGLQGAVLAYHLTCLALLAAFGLWKGRFLSGK